MSRGMELRRRNVLTLRLLVTVIGLLAVGTILYVTVAGL